MMNRKIKNLQDEKFYTLLDFIKNSPEQELFNYIKIKFLSLPPALQTSFENYFSSYTFWGSLKAGSHDFNHILLKTKSLKNHVKDLEWLYEKLEDYGSKFVLYAIIENFVNYNFDLLKKSLNFKYRQYFDFDIMPRCKDEVFVDVGTYLGETILDFVDLYGKDCYKNIYAYEITSDIFPHINKNLSGLNVTLRNKAVGEKNKKLFLNQNITSLSANTAQNIGEKEIECVSLDSNIDEKITLVKMDIEGGEENAIKGCKNHIKNDSPKLLISVYHGFEHYFTLPRLIDRYNRNYKFYLRNYGGNLFPTEIVLCALPK